MKSQRFQDNMAPPASHKLVFQVSRILVTLNLAFTKPGTGPSRRSPAQLIWRGMTTGMVETPSAVANRPRPGSAVSAAYRGRVGRLQRLITGTKRDRNDEAAAALTYLQCLCCRLSAVSGRRSSATEVVSNRWQR